MNSPKLAIALHPKEQIHILQNPVPTLHRKKYSSGKIRKFLGVHFFFFLSKFVTFIQVLYSETASIGCHLLSNVQTLE